jgi:diacylglycerol kinase (ATP)
MENLNNDDYLKWLEIDCIYYEYGSLIIIYNNLLKANKAFNLLKQVIIDDRQLIVLILPKIQSTMITPNKIPLLVFVNVKSGGQQGIELVNSFRNLLNPHQVFDLQNGGPLPGLYVFRNLNKYRILACGGDGTIGWILSCLDNISQDAKCESPAMAVLPLGTGNDLARVLRWGAGYTGTQEPINILNDIINADEIRLDRWTVVFHVDDNNNNSNNASNLPILPSSNINNNIIQQDLNDNNSNMNSININEDNTEIFVMNNYFGIGIDADISLDFHMARKENPNKFNSRLMNKKYYLQIGLRKMMNKACNYSKDFNKNVTLEVDGKRIDLPQIEGIIILNILR